MPAPHSLEVLVKSVTFEAEAILGYRLVAADGGALPPATAGAHLDVHLPGGGVRQYSLCGDPACRDHYEIAVLREAGGRGGSRAMHETVRPGDRLTVSAPRNRFPLDPSPGPHLLLAGGIGITPMMAMIAELEARGADWQLHFCTRSPARTPFRGRLAPHLRSGRAHLHHDGGDPSRGLDIAALLAAPAAGTHVYYCGPPGFMAAAAAATRDWPRDRVHSESFTAPAGSPGEREAGNAFRIRLERSGEEMEVPPGRSIVEVLRANGHYVDTSCEDGYCGTCLTPYLQGEPEHHDSVLDDEDRRRYVLICCARSRTPTLVLDL